MLVVPETMSTKTRQAPLRIISSVNGISSLPDSLRKAQDIKAAIVSFVSETGFDELSRLADRIPQLEKETREKDDQIEVLTTQLDNERKQHVAEQQKELRTYNRMYDEFRDGKTLLQNRVDELQDALQKKDTAVAGLQKELEDFKTKGRELEAKFKAKITKLKEKEQDIASLQEQLQEAQASADNSSKKLSESRGRVVKLEESLEKSRSQHDNLKTEFDATTGKLNELLSFAVPLDDLDLRTV
jgi:chromosome segregation ATPase